MDGGPSAQSFAVFSLLIDLTIFGHLVVHSTKTFPAMCASLLMLYHKTPPQVKGQRNNRAGKYQYFPARLFMTSDKLQKPHNMLVVIGLTVCQTRKNASARHNMRMAARTRPKAQNSRFPSEISSPSSFALPDCRYGLIFSTAPSCLNSEPVFLNQKVTPALTHCSRMASTHS